MKERYEFEEYPIEFDGTPMEPRGVFLNEEDMHDCMLMLESEYDVKMYHNPKTGFYSLRDTESDEKYTATRIEYNGEVGYDLTETFVCQRVDETEVESTHIGVNHNGIMDFTHAFSLLKSLGYSVSYDVPTDTFHIKTDKGMQTIKGKNRLYDTNVLK